MRSFSSPTLYEDFLLHNTIVTALLTGDNNNLLLAPRNTGLLSKDLNSTQRQSVSRQLNQGQAPDRDKAKIHVLGFKLVRTDGQIVLFQTAVCGETNKPAELQTDSR